MKNEVIYIETERLRPYPGNARKNDESARFLQESIREFDFTNPILTDKDLVIIAGHTRLKAAQALGIKSLPVIVIDDLDPLQVRALRLADNKVGDGTKWNNEKLAEELKKLKGAFNFKALGFGETELKKYLDAFTLDQAAEDGEAAPKKCRVKNGDVWKCGNSLLLCADPFEKGVAKEFLKGAAMMCFTKPPADLFQDPGAVIKAMRLCLFSTAGAVYFGLNPDFIGDTKSQWEAAGGILSDYLVGVKPEGETGPVFAHRWSAYIYGWRDGQKHYFSDDKSLSDVWWTDESARKTSVAFCAKALKNNSLPEGIIFDPFGGEGTTLIAAEQSYRHARVIEQDPSRCSAIIDRWEAMAHSHAEKIG